MRSRFPYPNIVVWRKAELRREMDESHDDMHKHHDVGPVLLRRLGLKRSDQLPPEMQVQIKAEYRSYLDRWLRAYKELSGL